MYMHMYIYIYIYIYKYIYIYIYMDSDSLEIFYRVEWTRSANWFSKCLPQGLWQSITWSKGDPAHWCIYGIGPLRVKLSLYLLSGTTSYRQTLRSLHAAKLDVTMIEIWHVSW